MKIVVFDDVLFELVFVVEWFKWVCFLCLVYLECILLSISINCIKWSRIGNVIE